MKTVAEFRSALAPDIRGLVDALRETISSANASLHERVKWNAPSFAIDDDDRITLGIERKGGVRVVFHRGAKIHPNADFTFEDPDGLLKWPASDRGVVVFQTLDAFTAKHDAFLDVCRRWVDATGSR